MKVVSSKNSPQKSRKTRLIESLTKHLPLEERMAKMQQAQALDITFLPDPQTQDGQPKKETGQRPLRVFYPDNVTAIVRPVPAGSEVRPNRGSAFKTPPGPMLEVENPPGAALAGHIEILKWAHEHLVPSDAARVETYLRTRDLKVLATLTHNERSKLQALIKQHESPE